MMLSDWRWYYFRCFENINAMLSNGVRTQICNRISDDYNEASIEKWETNGYEGCECSIDKCAHGALEHTGVYVFTQIVSSWLQIVSEE